MFDDVLHQQETTKKRWKYNTRKNVNSDVSEVTMGRVAIIFFKLRVIKN